MEELFINDYKKIQAKYGKTHIIEKVEGTEVNLKKLAPDEMVLWGDGETYHWKLIAIFKNK